MVTALKSAIAALVIVVALAAVVLVWQSKSDDLNESRNQMRADTVESLEGD